MREAYERVNDLVEEGGFGIDNKPYTKWSGLWCTKRRLAKADRPYPICAEWTYYSNFLNWYEKQELPTEETLCRLVSIRAASPTTSFIVDIPTMGFHVGVMRSKRPHSNYEGSYVATAQIGRVQRHFSCYSTSEEASLRVLQEKVNYAATRPELQYLLPTMQGMMKDLRIKLEGQ